MSRWSLHPAGAWYAHTGFPLASGVPRFVADSVTHPSLGACPAASGCHRLPRVPAAGAPMPAPHPRYGGGPFLPGQAAPSAFACGEAKGETEALQSVLVVTRRWRGPGQPSGQRRRSSHPRLGPRGPRTPLSKRETESPTAAGAGARRRKAAGFDSVSGERREPDSPSGTPGWGAGLRMLGGPGVGERGMCKDPGAQGRLWDALGAGSPRGGG